MRVRVITAAVVATALTACPPAGATFPGKNGRIMFSESRSLYSLSVKSGKTTRLVQGENTNGGSWSPGAKSFTYGYYDSRSQVGGIAVRTRSGDTTRILDGAHHIAYQPSFSGPEGKRIAYFHFAIQGRRSQIWLMRSDGSDQHQIIAARSRRVKSVEPSFSPDGRSIVFGRYRTGHGHTVFVAHADGSRTHRVLRSVRGDIRGPSYSPDGRRLVFVVLGRHADRVGIKDLGGGPVRYLSPRGRNEIYSAVYSPNGRRVAYVAHREAQNRDVIFSVSTDGGNRRQIYQAKRPGYHVDSPLSWADR